MGTRSGFNPKEVLTFEALRACFLQGAIRRELSGRHFARFTTNWLPRQALKLSRFSGALIPWAVMTKTISGIVDRPIPQHQSDLPMTLEYVVEPDYLKVMQIPLKRGRFFTAADNETAPAVAVIDETLAAKVFSRPRSHRPVSDLQYQPR